MTPNFTTHALSASQFTTVVPTYLSALVVADKKRTLEFLDLEF